MGSRITAYLKYSISFLLAGVLLWFAFRNVDFVEFWAKSKLVNYWWVLFSILISLIAYGARAYRWNLLLEPLGHPNLSTYKTTLAVMVGYLANLAFPRLGEVTRCGMLKRSDEVPVSSSLGTVITERLVDLLVLILLMLFTLVAEYDRIVEFIAQISGRIDMTERLGWQLLATAGGLGVLGLLVFIVLFRRSAKVREFVRLLLGGIFSLTKLRNLPGFVISTVILWGTYYFMSYVIVFSMAETAHLDWMVGVMLLVTGGIALALPVQGGIGTYHVFVSAMLVLYSIEKTTGVFLATLLHTSQIIAIAIFGGIALVLSFFVKKRLPDGAHTPENQE